MVRSKIFRLGLIHFRLKFPKAIKGHARILLVPSQSLHFIGWSTDKPSILRNKKNIKGSSKNLGLGSVVKIQEHLNSMILHISYIDIIIIWTDGNTIYLPQGCEEFWIVHSQILWNRAVVCILFLDLEHKHCNRSQSIDSRVGRIKL